MRLKDFPEETRINEKVFRLVSYVLVAMMLACGALTVIHLITRLIPPWKPWYIAVICFAIALDALYSYRRYSQMSIFSSEWFLSVGTQLVIYLVVIRVAIGVSHGLDVFLAELSSGWFAFLLSFFTIEAFIISVLAIITWLLSGYFAELLDEMGLDQALVLQDAESGVPTDVPPARDRLISLVFSVGSVLVMLTALMRLDLRALSDQTRSLFLDVPSLSSGGVSTLLYFMLALALFSQTQFVSLHISWSLQRIPVNRTVAGRWALYSLIFLLLLAGIVSLLPTSYSLGLLAAVGFVLNALGWVLFLIAQLLLTILLLIISLPFLLFGKQPPVQATPPATPEIPELPAEMLNPAAPFPWIELLKSLLFWGLFLGVLIFSLSQYLRQHEEVLQAMRKMPGWAWLARFWDWLRGAFRTVRAGISDAVATGWERLQPRRRLMPELGGWINLRRLDPRQRVYFFYLALVRRSGETGLPRRQSQTPTEFAATLDSALPEAEPDIDGLTTAFIEARYTPRPVEAEKVNVVKEYWEHIKRALRGKRAESGK
jgi:hypothetical protein